MEATREAATLPKNAQKGKDELLSETEVEGRTNRGVSFGVVLSLCLITIVAEFITQINRDAAEKNGMLNALRSCFEEPTLMERLPWLC